MSDIQRATKSKLETLFGMDSGYVMEFSNRKFEEFVFDETRLNIFDEKYNEKSGSKANRLRAFWKLESNQVVATLSLGLLEFWEQEFRLSDPTEEEFYRLYRLKEAAEKELETLKGTPNKSFDMAALNVSNLEESYLMLKEDIEKVLNEDKPQLALDRVHTYMTKYFRVLCEKHGIDYTSKENINNMYGKYIRFHHQYNSFESVMTPKILKLPTQVLEKFNSVRNNESFAHSNEIIGYRESKLIIDFVFLVLSYIIDLEKEYDEKKATVI